MMIWQKMENVEMWVYVESPAFLNNPQGSITKYENKIIWTAGTSSGNANSIGHAKRAVQKLANKNV